jgi:hypothetical protein
MIPAQQGNLPGQAQPSDKAPTFAAQAHATASESSLTELDLDGQELDDKPRAACE